MTTRAPSCAKRMAIPCPMPELAPVTTAMRPLRRAMHFLLSTLSSMRLQRGQRVALARGNGLIRGRASEESAEEVCAPAGPSHHDQHDPEREEWNEEPGVERAGAFGKLSGSPWERGAAESGDGEHPAGLSGV